MTFAVTRSVPGCTGVAGTAALSMNGIGVELDSTIVVTAPSEAPAADASTCAFARASATAALSACR